MRSVLTFAACLLAASASAAPQTATSTLTVTILGPLGITFSPAAPSIACNAPSGTVVTAISISGGDNNPVAISMTGSLDFALTATSLPSNIVVNNNGIAAADCGKAVNVTVTATQN